MTTDRTIAHLAKLNTEARERNARQLTVTMRVDHLDVSHPITLTGARVAVLRGVALLSGLASEDCVEIRPCTVDDDKLLVVDASQADSYPAFLAEVVRSTYRASVPSALRWAATAVAGEYLVKYEDTGLTDSEDPGSRCGYGDDELDAIRRELGKRDLTLAADDCGLVAQEER